MQDRVAINDAHRQPGFVGWLKGSRHGLEAYVYLLHRLTGVILLVFVVAHILLSSSRLLGWDTWADLMKMTTLPVVQVFRYPLLAAFAFHAANGLRLVLVELGIAVGRPEQQVYPYRGSIARQRPLLLVMMVLAALFFVAGEFDLLRLSH